MHVCLGLARTINIRCTYGIFGREVTKYTVIYGVYIRFWPALRMSVHPGYPLETPHTVYTRFLPNSSINVRRVLTTRVLLPFLFLTKQAPHQGPYQASKREKGHLVPCTMNTSVWSLEFAVRHKGKGDRKSTY
jgi:hypothetical protein